MFATRTGRRMMGTEGGEEGIDDAFFTAGDVDIGATVMGRNMFGPIRGEWGDEEWTGWWGDDPPYHHPVFVLTHHPRPAITMQGGTTFDEMHYVISPILLGSGERLFDHLDGGPDGYKCVELVTSTSVIHVRIVRA